MNFRHPFFPKHAFLFKNGGAGKQDIQAPPGPSVSQTSVEVTQAKVDAARRAKTKQGINSTVLAGEAPASMGGASGNKATLLGGG